MLPDLTYPGSARELIQAAEDLSLKEWTRPPYPRSDVERRLAGSCIAHWIVTTAVGRYSFVAEHVIRKARLWTSADVCRAAGYDPSTAWYENRFVDLPRLARRESRRQLKRDARKQFGELTAFQKLLHEIAGK